MRYIMSFIIAVLLIAAPAFGELSVEDLDKIRQIVKESNAELRAELKDDIRVLYWFLGGIGVLLLFLTHRVMETQRTLGRVLERTDILLREWERRSEMLAAQQDEIAKLRTELERSKAQIVKAR